MLLQTSIQKLDELIGGGIEATKSVLFCSQPGIDEIPFAYQFLFYRLQKGDKGIYLVNNKIPKVIRNKLKAFDWNIENYEKKGVFAFFDCYSSYIGAVSEEKFSSQLEPKKIKEKLFEALEKIKNKNTILIIDSLSTFLDLCGPEELFPCIKELFKKCQELNVTPIFLFTDWPYSKKLKHQVKEMFDCIVELKSIEKTMFLRNYFSLSKASWLGKLNNQEIPFKVLEPGGIRAYIPKILVTGPYNAGKSSFVHSASIKAISVERIGLEKEGTTVALDHGHVDHDGFAADLLGTPGQERFDPLLKLLGGESLGAIVIVDSTQPKTFERAREMIEKTKIAGLPTVIVANKANLKGALKPGQIKKKMGFGKEVQVIPVVAENLRAIREGMKKKQPCKLKKEDVGKVLSILFKEII